MGNERQGPGLFPTATEWDELASQFQWSDRETQVVRLLMTGTTRKEVAYRLGVSVNTVHTHVRRALQKCERPDMVALLWCIVDLRDRLRSYRFPVIHGGARRRRHTPVGSA